MDSLMFEMAKEAKRNAYAPYSKFRVGAAIKSAEGNIYSGCNVENASYPVGICAEVNAVSSMITAGDIKITEVALCCDGKTFCTPCGRCRQFLSEFCDAETPVHLFKDDGNCESYTISQLLPFAFNL